MLLSSNQESVSLTNLLGVHVQDGLWACSSLLQVLSATESPLTGAQAEALSLLESQNDRIVLLERIF